MTHTRRFFRTKWKVCTVAALALATLSSCSSKPPRQMLRIGINPWPAYEFLYLAQEKGYFREEGIEVRLVEYSSLSECRRGFELRQIDAMACTMIELLEARAQSNRTPQAFLAIDYSNGADEVLVRDDSKGVAGLKNLRVAVEPASLNVFVLARALEGAGLTLDDVKLTYADAIKMPALFKSGAVDAAVNYPPVTGELKRLGARSIFTSAQIPGEILDILVMDKPILDARADDAARICRAFHHAVRFADAHPDDAHPIMARRERLNVEEFVSALQNGVRLTPADKQAENLGPGGIVERVAIKVDGVLRRAGQLQGPARLADCAFFRGAQAAVASSGQD